MGGLGGQVVGCNGWVGGSCLGVWGGCNGRGGPGGPGGWGG